jgi:hypothetical protein
MIILIRNEARKDTPPCWIKVWSERREREKFRSTAMEVMQKNHKWSAKIKVAIIFYIN